MQVLIAALSPFTFTGTALLKNAVGYTELTLYAPEIAAAKAAAAALAAGERPLPIGVGKTSSSWKKVPSASRPGAFSYLHEPSGYGHKPDCLPNCMRGCVRACLLKWAS